MLWYCLKLSKKCRNKNPKVAHTHTHTKKKNPVRIMLLLICAICESKKSKFIKQQEASGLLSGLGIKIPVSKIPLVGPLLF